MLDHGTLIKETCLIDGEWTGAQNGATYEVIDPASGAVLGRVPDCDADDTRRAVEAAARAFGTFRNTLAAERAAMLHRLHDLLLAWIGPLARILTREQGKPLAEAEAEIRGSAAYIRWFAEEARRTYGEVIPSPWPGRQLMVTREPVGVVGVITPWNFPSSMLSRKIGPAIAAGCTVVIKPAPQTPLSGLAWGVLTEAAGIPPGVVNIVTGLDAEAIGDVLCTHPEVRKITFTGSTPVGKLLLAKAAGTVKRASMELGGNAPFIVFEDADLESAVAGAMAAKYRNGGQTCICANRIYVQSGIHDAFVARLVEESAKITVGSGLEPGITQGPLIDDRAVAKVSGLIEDAVAKGAKLEVGGGVHALGGRFFQPTVLSGNTDGMRLSREEIFGPVAAIFRFDTEEEVINRANATEYGLAAYFYTRDLGRTHRVSAGLKYGMVGVNDGLITTEVAPFGGVKESGLGREGARQGLDEYMDLKYLSVGGLA